jgi:amidase
MLDRRAFLQSTAAAGVAAAGLPGLTPSRRAPVLPPPGDLPAFELEEVTIAALQEGMKAGKWSARALTEIYIARIEALDPAVRSVLEINPDAAAMADQLDAERKAKKLRGPLHGIPILVKDNVATADRMATTAGSRALLGVTPPRDAAVARRLRDAGAVLLGKTNLSEWANFRSTHSTSGWSGRGGQCRNPYALDRNPSGSSSGSGVAVAANFCAAAVGTETDGSIVSPSSCCGIVGIKPTLGLVSRAGVIPIAHSQDTAGPMARTVADAALLLGALAGADPRDPATAAGAGKALADYAKFLDPNGLRGARLGLPRNKLYGYSARVDALMEEAIAVLKQAGAVIVDPADIPTLGQFDDSEFEVLLYEFKADLNRYLADLGPAAPAKSLEELVAWNAAHRDAELPYFGQEIFEKALAKGPLTDQAYLDALAKDQRLSRAEGIDAVMDKYQLDALVAPTNSPSGLIDLVNGDSGGGSCSTPAAVAGYPHVTVPAGFVFGLPVGISFFGRAWSEGTLIKLAYAYEQATKRRRPPRFLPTVDLSPA